MTQPDTIQAPGLPSKTPPWKAKLKFVIHCVCVLWILPVLCWHHIMALFIGHDRALEGSTQILAPWPGLPGMFLRRAFLNCVLAKCDRNSEISYGVLIAQCATRIDENVYVGPNCHLGMVHLEKDVLVAAGVHIPSGGQTHYFHDPNVPIREQGGERQMVRIGEGAWIGSAAIVLADVGRGSIIGAGSVVTKPIPEFVIAAGVPAKVIRPRFADTQLD